MPHRVLVARELADLLGVLAHPIRIRLVEELREGEHCVSSLQTVLGISHSSVSQHLALFRAHRVVRERREGRMVMYSLRQPDLAMWLLDAMKFLEQESRDANHLRSAIKKTRVAWSTDHPSH